MSAASPLDLPPGRAAAGWWEVLARLNPQRVWFAHLVLHRLEVLVEVAHPRLSPLARALLGLLATHPGEVDLPALAAALALPGDLTASLVAALVDEGLVETAGPGRAGAITPAGQAVLAGGKATTTPSRERRVFCFVDTRPPIYLPLPAGETVPLPPPAGWRFDLGLLEHCLNSPLEWKMRNHFPPEVTGLVSWREGEDDWRGVPLDCPSQALLLLLELESGELVGWRIWPGEWDLSPDPVLRLAKDSDAAALLPELRLEDWRRAWQGWCLQRQLSAAEADGCKLESLGTRLLVKGPPRILERIRQARMDAWLLAGQGRIRQMAVVEPAS